MFNSKIIELFSLLVKQIEAEYLNARVENDVREMSLHKHRLQSTKKILSIIKNLDFEIEDPGDVDGIPGIGKGTKSRIAEILETGGLSELKSKYDKAKQSRIDSIQELERVIGIGSAVAKKLITEHNITSINELKKAVKSGKIKVSDQIKLGLKYYGVVEGKIPRSEISSVQKFLSKEAEKIDDRLEVIVCGSYRRGKATSGDIDLLMYHPDITKKEYITDPEKYDSEPYLEIFIEKLSDDGFLLDHMTDKNFNMKYMGFCQYKNNPVRRIDIRFVPYSSLPTALLYFTGPYELNQIMRSAAKKRSMILNEYGLYKLDKDENRKIIKLNSEKDVFEILGMNYMTPAERETFSTGKIKKLNNNLIFDIKLLF